MYTSVYLSVIVPVWNEEANILPLHNELLQVLHEHTFSYEIIYVDDGSRDGTSARLQQVMRDDEPILVVQLSRNFGQTAALAAGIVQSRGRVLVFMDGDMQNDPRDIPRLLAKLDEGYDLVSGWRKQRKDARWSRKIPSVLANRLIAHVTGIPLHDYGCTLKAYRREVFQYIRLYGEMHRFIPAYAAIVGAAIAEIEVAHRSRYSGRSKYDLRRTVNVLLDLVTLKFFGSVASKPIYALGLPGLLGILLGLFLSLLLLGRKLVAPRKQPVSGIVLPISVHSTSFGVQCLMLGLLAEVLMRTYHESQGKAPYVVKSIISSDTTAQERSLSMSEQGTQATLRTLAQQQ